MTEQLWKTLLADVESSFTMVERIAEGEVSTGWIVGRPPIKIPPGTPAPERARLDQSKPMQALRLTAYEEWRIKTLEFLMELWGDFDEEQYNRLREKLTQVQRDLEQKRKDVNFQYRGT